MDTPVNTVDVSRADAALPESADPYTQRVGDIQPERRVGSMAVWLVTPRHTTAQTLVWYVVVVFASWFVPQLFRWGSSTRTWQTSDPFVGTIYRGDNWTEPMLESVLWIVLVIAALLLIASGWLISRSAWAWPVRTVPVKLPWVTGLALGLMLANLFVLAMRGVGMMLSVKVVLVIDAVLVPLVIACAVGALARLAAESNTVAPTSNPV